MPEYRYEVVDKYGKHTKANIEAANIDRVKSILATQDLIVLEVKEASLFSKDIEIGRVKTKDLAVFCQQMYSIVKAGVSTLDALVMTQSTTQNGKLKKALNVIIEKVKGGLSLSFAMKDFADIFPPVMIQMIKAGEESGQLDEIFERLSIQFDKTYRMHNQIKSALAYPKMIIVVMALALCIVCAYIVPMFVDIFKELNTALPWSTKLFMALSDLFTKKWYVLVGIIVFSISFWLILSHNPKGRRFIDKAKLKIPLVNNLVIKTASANFARTLSTLLKAGMDYPTSLDIVKDTMDNTFFIEGIENIKVDVENGIPLTDSLKKTQLFPELLENLLQVGEETGNIEQMLENSANYFEDEVQTATKRLTAALNPIIIVVLGVFVGLLVYSIYTPMFSMYQGIG